MNSISYDKLLELFIAGKCIDETVFYFQDDQQEEEHHIGYLPECGKPYWAGYCDIEDGCEYFSAIELFTAPIYNGLSIKDRYENLIIVAIGGIDVDDWFKYYAKELLP